MRVHFELKYGSDDVEKAHKSAQLLISKFMQVEESAVPSLVDVELRVSLPDPEKDKDWQYKYVITAYGNVKHSIAKPL